MRILKFIGIIAIIAMFTAASFAMVTMPPAL